MRSLLLVCMSLFALGVFGQAHKVERYFYSATPPPCKLLVKVHEGNVKGKCLSQVVSLYLSAKDTVNKLDRSVFLSQMESDSMGKCVFNLPRSGKYMVTTGCGKYAVGVEDGIAVSCPTVKTAVVIAPVSYCGVTLYDGVDSSEAVILANRTNEGVGYRAEQGVIRGIPVWICVRQERLTNQNSSTVVYSYVAIDRKTGELVEQGTKQGRVG